MAILLISVLGASTSWMLLSEQRGKLQSCFGNNYCFYSNGQSCWKVNITTLISSTIAPVHIHNFVSVDATTLLPGCVNLVLQLLFLHYWVYKAETVKPWGRVEVLFCRSSISRNKWIRRVYGMVSLTCLSYPPFLPYFPTIIIIIITIQPCCALTTSQQEVPQPLSGSQ